MYFSFEIYDNIHFLTYFIIKVVYLNNIAKIPELEGHIICQTECAAITLTGKYRSFETDCKNPNTVKHEQTFTKYSEKYNHEFFSNCC